MLLREFSVNGSKIRKRSEKVFPKRGVQKKFV